MKKVFFILALFMQTVLVAAAKDKAVTAQPHLDNVKMYSQPGTSTEVLKSLLSTDEVVVVRKHNNQWMIVSVDGKVGYVLASELIQPKKAKK
jgi:uncharacterized protein YgiM (DUF1202 family)